MRRDAVDGGYETVDAVGIGMQRAHLDGGRIDLPAHVEQPLDQDLQVLPAGFRGGTRLARRAAVLAQDLIQLLERLAQRGQRVAETGHAGEDGLHLPVATLHCRQLLFGLPARGLELAHPLLQPLAGGLRRRDFLPQSLDSPLAAKKHARPLLARAERFLNMYKFCILLC